MEEIKFSELLGKILMSIEKVENVEFDELIFTTNEGEMYKMFHDQSCCEEVKIEDIEGDLNDLIGFPILQAEEVVNSDEPKPKSSRFIDDSFTWTFYKLATIKGYVTIRWLGESNSCYSEKVSFIKIRTNEINKM